METFSNLRHTEEKDAVRLTTAAALHENKDSRINRLNITDEEKETLKKFFRQHPEKESAIDWNRKDLTYADFKPLLDTVSKSEVKRQIKAGRTKGLGLLVEGRDYEVAGQQGTATLYKILDYEAMCIIASNDVLPALTLAIPEWARRPENEWYQYYKAHKEEMDQAAAADGAITNAYGNYTPYAPGAHWCVAMKNTRSFWQDYHEDRGLSFYVLCDTSRTDEFGKICLYREDEENHAWSARDEEFSLESLLHSSVMSDDAKALTEEFEFETPKEPEELQNAVKEFYHLNFDIEYWKEYEVEPEQYKGRKLKIELSGDEDPFGGYEQQLTLTIEGLGEDIDEDLWDDMSEALKGNDLVWDCELDEDEAYVEIRVKPSDKKEKILKVLTKVDKLFRGASKFEVSKAGIHIANWLEKFYNRYWIGDRLAVKIEGHRVSWVKSRNAVKVVIGDLSDEEKRQIQIEDSRLHQKMKKLESADAKCSIRTETTGTFIMVYATFSADATDSDLEKFVTKINSFIEASLV